MRTLTAREARERSLRDDVAQSLRHAPILPQAAGEVCRPFEDSEVFDDEVGEIRMGHDRLGEITLGVGLKRGQISPGVDAKLTTTTCMSSLLVGLYVDSATPRRRLNEANMRVS